MSTPKLAPRDKIAVSIDEAASMLSVSRRHFYDWAMPSVTTGRIRSMRVGRRVLIFVDSLLEWVNAQATNA